MFLRSSLFPPQVNGKEYCKLPVRELWLLFDIGGQGKGSITRGVCKFKHLSLFSPSLAPASLTNTDSPIVGIPHVYIHEFSSSPLGQQSRLLLLDLGF